MCQTNKTRYTLLQRAMQNDENAWRELQNHYRNFIYYFLHKLNVRESDLDDIAQEVMITLSSKLENYDPDKGLFRTWLRTVVRNHTLMFFRKESTRNKYNERFQEENVLFNEEASDEFNQKFDLEWKNHILKVSFDKIKSSFSDDAAEIIQLELDGLSVNEIAEKLNKTTGAVYKMRTRVQRSLVIQVKDTIKELGMG